MCVGGNRGSRAWNIRLLKKILTVLRIRRTNLGIYCITIRNSQEKVSGQVIGFFILCLHLPLAALATIREGTLLEKMHSCVHAMIKHHTQSRLHLLSEKRKETHFGPRLHHHQCSGRQSASLRTHYDASPQTARKGTPRSANTVPRQPSQLPVRGSSVQK